MTNTASSDQDALYKHWRWRIFIITWLAYAGFYLTRKSFAVAKVDLAKPEVMGLGLGELSWMDIGYATAYAAGQFVWGMCGDRYGTRQVILCGMMASVLTAICMGASSLVLMLGILFCLQGVCQSTGWAPLTKNIGNFYAQKERGRMMGFWCTNYALGGVIASWLAGYSIEWMGQKRMAEYQAEETLSVAHVQQVAIDQGYDKNTGEIIYGYLSIAQVAKPPPGEPSDSEVGKRLNATRTACNDFLRDEKLNPLVRAAALRGLFDLREPKFNEALMAALRSKDAALRKAGQGAIKKAAKSKVPKLRHSALMTLQEAVLSADGALRQLGLDVALNLSASAQREFAVHIAGQSSDPEIEKLASHLKSEIDKRPEKTAAEDPPKFDPEKALASIHNKSIQTIWGMLAWRYAFWVPAAVLAVIWLLFLGMQRNRPQDVGLPPIEEYRDEKKAVLTGNAESEEAEEGTWQLIWQVMSNRMVQLLAGVYLLLKPTRYYILFWSPLYLNAKLGTGAAESGILGSMFELAGPLGVLMGGYLSDKVFGARRIPVAVIGLLVVAAVLLGFNALPSTKWALGSAFFFIGFFLYMPDSLVAGTAALDFGTRKGAGTAAGMINGFGSIGAVVGVSLPGVLSSLLGEDADIWWYIFPGLGVSLLIAALLLLPRWNAMPATVDDEEEKQGENH